MMNNVYLDLDGVLAGFVEGVCLHFSVTNPYELTENFGKYDLVSLLNIDPSRFWDSLDCRFWAELPLEDGALELYDLVNELVDQKDIYILTKPAQNPQSMVGKFKWVNRWFPELTNKIIFTKCKACCAGNNAYLIDDDQNNTSLFKTFGGRAFTYPQPWNYKHDEIDRRLVKLRRLLEDRQWTLGMR